MTTPWTSLLPTALANDVDLSRVTAIIPLPSLAVLSLSGPESLKFLQGQTTTDFREVEKGRALPGAVCSLKGRVLFSFMAIPDGENVQLIMPADQIEAALAHLKKYSVFSRTQLHDARKEMVLAGVSGGGAEKKIQALLGKIPQRGEVVKSSRGKWAARIGHTKRYLLGLPTTSLTNDWPTLHQDTTLAGESLWQSLDIEDGIATVFAASRDLFQPQELNYHAIEGVSYNKGCYTGQEVVARLYFRGKLKQRLYRLGAFAASLPSIGSAIFSDSTHVGDVVMAAAHAGGKVEILAVVKNRAVAEDRLSLDENGSHLEVLPLPYELPADKEE